MTGNIIVQDVHGVDEFWIHFGGEQDASGAARKGTQQNIPTLATTVQKTKQWITELMGELQWHDAQRAYHGLRSVLHALRDQLTSEENADFAAQLPMLLRGLYFEGWSPRKATDLDRSKAGFLKRIKKDFSRDPSVDAQQLAIAVLTVVRRHVSSGEVEDVMANLPKPLRELLDASRDSREDR